MMNKLTHRNRRQFLQGTGIALSLPALESFAAAAVDEGGAEKPSTDPGTLKVSIEELECYVYVRQ